MAGIDTVSEETPDNAPAAPPQERVSLGPALLWWCAVPALGVVWGAWHLRRSWFVYDEWSMIERVQAMGAGDGMMASFNGHLWMLQYWLYRVQVSVFGVDRHTFICVMFVLSLLLLHLGLAALLRAAGVPRASALLLGGVLTYLGAASQNFLFAVQVSPTLSLAAVVLAAAIVLSGRRSPAWQVLVAALLLAAVGIDSGTALGGAVLGATVVLLTWRSWQAALVVAPALLALAAWYRWGDLGPDFPATRWHRIEFAVHLGLRSAGSLVAGGEAVGAVLLVAAAAAVAVGWWRGWLPGPARTMVVAGSAAAALTIAGIAQSRAGLPGFTFENSNRYLQTGLIPIALAAAPAVAAACTRFGDRISARAGGRAGARSVGRWGSLAAPALLVVAFLLGLSPLRTYAAGFESWNVTVRHQVGVATVVVRDGCPSGTAPDPASRPIGTLSPQIPTSLLITLMARGALHAPAGVAVADLAADPLATPVVALMCPAG
ncbi:MAG: hypothetical protein Q7V88_07965 [Actinomycetota bacterium]|nr:hypothetical protein [Actinomycetota bacterium]